jgi:tetratricopeptide (TPR) repeat protein
MDATHLALFLVVLLIVIVLLAGRRRSGNAFTWTFRVPLGRRPKLDGLNMAGLSNGRFSDSSAIAFSRRSGVVVDTNAITKESLPQRLFEQLVLPKDLLGDLEVQKLFEQGFLYLQEKNYQRAVSVFRKAVNLAHHNLYLPRANSEVEGKIAALVHTNLASSLMAKGDLDAAIIEFREGLRLDPNLAALHDGLGACLLAKGDQAAAAGEFREAARLDPNLAVVHMNLSEALARKGDVEGAARERRRALNLNASLAERRDD